MKYYQQDIRNNQYRENILTNSNFQNALAGQNLIKKILMGIFSIVVAAFLSIVTLLAGGVLETITNVLKVSYFDFIEITAIALYTTALVIFVVRGFEIVSTTCVVALIVLGIVIYVCFEVNNKIPGIGFWLLCLGLSIAFAWVSTTITALFIAISSIYCGVIGEFLAVMGYGLIAEVMIISVSNIQHEKDGDGFITIIAAIPVIISSAFIAKKAIRGSPKFRWIREVAVFWTSIGGTSFYGADLTDASFDGADLRHTDFRKANLTRTSFKGVTGLELARLQGTILEEPKVRKLLTTNNGRGEDFTEANLQGANLQGADLREAILVKAQVLDADFSGALLTDACIQDWNINKNTRFQDVDCKRVYLKCSLHGNFLEPKPDSGEFQAGEFEKWITDVRDTIDLIIQNALKWRAFALYLTQTAINNEGLGLSVRSIENKGDGVVVAKVGVSLETNKTAIHEEITNHYNQAVDAIEAKYELVLQAKEGEIQRLQTFYDSQQKFIQGLITGIAETKREVIIKGEGNRVYMMNQAGDIMESNNQNISAGGNVDMSSGNRSTVGGDVTNSNLTLADANSQVSNSIQQLKDVSTDTSDELAKILTTLQKSINDEPALSENQKKEAL